MQCFDEQILIFVFKGFILSVIHYSSLYCESFENECNNKS